MKDFFALLYFCAVIACATIIFPSQFEYCTRQYPYLMGFVKVSLLATFGEYLKKRISTGKWTIESIKDFFVRFIVWGVFGMWFTGAFAFFSFGVEQGIKVKLWPQGNIYWVAFSKSLWINVLGGYGFVMMITHEWINQIIALKKWVGGEDFFAKISGKVWFSTIPLTIIFFWVPAHTITFSLPPEYRILMAGVLSVILGFLLTIKKR